jgi:hypothetical protein
MQAVTETETGNAGGHDEPQHKSMKMLAISKRDCCDRQHGDDDRDGQAMHDTDR